MINDSLTLPHKIQMQKLCVVEVFIDSNFNDYNYMPRVPCAGSSYQLEFFIDCIFLNCLFALGLSKLFIKHDFLSGIN